MSHVVKAARVHLVCWPAMVAWPWGVLASSLAINLLIQSLLDPATRSNGGSGGLISIYCVVALWAYQTVSQVFPFALGMGVTRRAYAAGTALVLAGQALAYGAALTVLRYVEGATDGFGVQLHFFRMPGMVQDNAFLQLLVFTVPFLMLSALVMVVAVVHHRWRQSGVLWLTILTGALAGAVVALITWLDAWPEVGGWFADTSAAVTLVLLPLALAALVAAAGYRLLRRATA
jgi:hypothetical protein